MCYMRRKIEGGVGALWESDDTNFLKPNGQSRNLNVYGYNWPNFKSDRFIDRLVFYLIWV